MGGHIFVTMKAPEEYGSFEQHSRWEITEVREPLVLRYIFQFADADGNRMSPAAAGVPDGVPADGEHEVQLVDLGGGRTRLEMIEHGYTTVEARDLSKGGLEQCLNKMATLVNNAY